MIRHEMPNNTPEQVRAYLGGALELVDELGPPDDLRRECFAKAVDLLSVKQILLEQPAPIGIPLPAMAIPRHR
jgi:hypothetical protein